MRQADDDVALDLSGAAGEFDLHWFNPRTGGDLQFGSVVTVEAGTTVSIGAAPADSQSDWVVLVRTVH